MNDILTFTPVCLDSEKDIEMKYKYVRPHYCTSEWKWYVWYDLF